MVFKAETHGDIGHLSGVTDIHVDASLVMLFDGETGQALKLGS